MDEECDTLMTTNEASDDTVIPAPSGPPVIPEVTLGHELARGGMGIVYRGRQEFLERDVAVKLLAPHLQGDRFGARFRREAKLLAGIKHPCIVACYAAGVTQQGQHYLVMELVAGPNLAQWIIQHGPVPVRSAVRIASQLAAALGHACDLGVIHRDIKTANILLEASNGSSPDPLFPFVPKLVDLGLARMVDGSTDLAQTAPGAVMGTPSTMAPEQFDAPDTVDFRADIYGLGCVLYEMLTGAPAYTSERLTDLVVAKRQPRGPDPSQTGAGVPAPLGALVASMLAQDPRDRPGDYRTLRALLDEAATASARPVLPAQESRQAPGPNLLRTAEFEFLAAAHGAAGAGSRAAPGSAFVSRVVEPSAEVVSAAPAAAARAVAAAPVKQVAPPRVIGARAGATPSRRRTGNRIAAAVVVGLLAAAAAPMLAGNREAERADPGPTPPAAAAAATPAPANHRPSVTILGADGPMRRGDRLLVRSRAEDADGDALQYEWSVQPSRAAVLATPAEANTALRHDLLPGDEFTLALAVRDAQERTEVVQRVVVNYEPKDLLGDFLAPTGDWQTPGRMRMPWRQLADGAVVATALEMPCLRTRNMTGSVWRVGGTMRPERGEARGSGPGPGPVQGAVSIRLGQQRHFAIACSREGQGGGRLMLSMQQVLRDDARPGVPILRPLPAGRHAPLEATDAAAATFTVTRRGEELRLEFGFAGRTERIEHVERLGPDIAEVPVGLLARGGRVVFAELRLW